MYLSVWAWCWCVWIVRVISTAQEALSMFGVILDMLLVFQCRTLPCQSPYTRLLLSIFLLAIFCIFCVWSDPTLFTCHSSDRYDASPLCVREKSYEHSQVTGGERGRPERQEQCKLLCIYMLSWQGLEQCCCVVASR